MCIFCCILSNQALTMDLEEFIIQEEEMEEEEADDESYEAAGITAQNKQ